MTYKQNNIDFTIMLTIHYSQWNGEVAFILFSSGFRNRRLFSFILHLFLFEQAN